MPISKNPADYQYAPPAARTRRVAKLLKLTFQVVTSVSCFLFALHALDLI